MRKIKINKTFCRALILIVIVTLLVVGLAFISDFLQNANVVESYDESSASNSSNTQEASSQADSTSSDISEPSDGIYYKGDWYEEREGISTWLFLGLDKKKSELDEDYQNSSTQSDFLILFVFDDTTETYQTIHINRDTMVDIDVLSLDGTEIVGEIFAQITLAHTYGKDEDDAANNTMRAVSKLLYGVPVENYMSMTLDVVPILNDLVGGVEVEILHDYSDIYPEMIEGEVVKLNGEQALAYVQQRVSVGNQTNLERMERQAQYMEALEKSIRDTRDLNEDFYLKIVTSIIDYIYSNASVQSLSIALDKYSSYSSEGNHSLEGEAVVGEKFVEFYPDEEYLQEIVMDIFYVKAED